MLPSAISRRATTVGLSFSQGTVGSAPLASRRARVAASSTSWKMFSTFGRQSSTVMRAMVSRKQAAGGRKFTGNRPGFAGLFGPIVDPIGSGVGASRARGPGSADQIFQQGREARSFGAELQAAAPQDLEQLCGGLFEVLVHDHVVEFRVMRHIGHRIPQAARDDFLAVGLAIAEPGLELRPRRREDEDAPAIGLRLAYLLRALPVDL